MEATTKVKLRSLAPYRRLFPKARGTDKTVKFGANVSDTIGFIPTIIKRCGWQVQRFCDQELSGLSTYEVCARLWDFVKYHIEYIPDRRGLEEVRSPRRLIFDGKGDCDCGTTFIGTCLYYMEISFALRITEYDDKGYYQHIYPVVILPNGEEIVIDFVVDKFNYEHPYTKKLDRKMELQFLDGIDDAPILGLDAVSLGRAFGNESELSELGKLLKHAKKNGGGSSSPKKQKFKDKLKKVAHVANRANPGAVLIRAGILASMKLNLMKVAETLRWGYASPDLAKSKGMDMSKYDKVKKVLDKARSVFFAAGGKEENLRKAILTGRGNRSHDVAGLGRLSENTPLPELLGAIYDDEFVHGVEGLGVVSETAAIASATTAMGALAALLKSIGSLFPHKKDNAGDSVPPDSGADSGSDSASSESGSETPSTPAASSDTGDNATPPAADPPSDDNTPAPDPPASDNGDGNLPATVPQADPPAETDPPPDSDPPPDEGTSGLGGLGSSLKSFYEKNSNWILPTAGVIVGSIATALYMESRSKSKPAPVIQTINGPPKQKKGKGKGGKKKSNKQSVIALM